MILALHFIFYSAPTVTSAVACWYATPGLIVAQRVETGHWVTLTVVATSDHNNFTDISTLFRRPTINYSFFCQLIIYYDFFNLTYCFY